MKLAFFGMSRIIAGDESNSTRTQLRTNSFSLFLTPFGTDGWIAPEVLKGERTCTEAVDIFPLSLIFVFLLSGGFHLYDVDLPNDTETEEEALNGPE